MIIRGGHNEIQTGGKGGVVFEQYGQLFDVGDFQMRGKFGYVIMMLIVACPSKRQILPFQIKHAKPTNDVMQYRPSMGKFYCMLILFQPFLGFYQDSLVSDPEIFPVAIHQILISLYLLSVKVLGVSVENSHSHREVVGLSVGERDARHCDSCKIDGFIVMTVGYLHLVPGRGQFGLQMGVC
jgi:hypothetical protein